MTTSAQRLGKTITELRKSRGVTQETLAEAMGISAQSVSKWETGASMPDVSLLPMLSDYFDVSIDYLFRGRDVTYGDFLTAVCDRVRAKPYEAGYEEFLQIAMRATDGLHCGNLRMRSPDSRPDVVDIRHHGGEGGLVTHDSRGMIFGVTRDFFTRLPAGQTAAFMAQHFAALASPDACLVLLAVLSMDDIAFSELSAVTALSDAALRASLDGLIASGLLMETVSKHGTLGTTYHVADKLLPAAVLLCAGMASALAGLDGYSCCLGPGDYPIRLANACG